MQELLCLLDICRSFELLWHLDTADMSMVLKIPRGFHKYIHPYMEDKTMHAGEKSRIV
jgi:hypothetical protein